MKVKIVIAMAILLAAVSNSKAQDFQTMGVYNKAELEMKECPFDRDADAIVLLDEGYSTYDDYDQKITLRHVRIKILKDKGIGLANWRIEYDRENNFQYLDKIEGFTANVNASGNLETASLDKKSIFDQKKDENTGEVKFIFPAVKVGSIIEYSYRITQKRWTYQMSWEFQQNIPVLTSKYKIFVLPYVEFAYHVNKRNEYNINIKPDKEHGGISFEMNNIPGLKYEPYIDARKDYLQSVSFQLSGQNFHGFKENVLTTWDEATRSLSKSPRFGSQLDKRIPGTDHFIKEVLSLSTALEKMKKVYNYVKDNMKWNGDDSKYSTDVKSAWNNKSGTSGDLNLLLVNLLKAGGLDVNPMLVSERDHGKVNTDYPYLDDFNTVYAVVNVGNKNYYLDATNKSCPAEIIPFQILNTKGFVVSRENGGFVDIKDESFKYKDNIIIEAEPTTDGNLKGKVSLSSDEYSKVSRVGPYKADQTKYMNSYFTDEVKGAKIEKFQVTNFDKDSLPLVHEFEFTVPLNTSGDYKFINLNLFTGLNENPFISDHRFSNINFGYKQQIGLTESITIPQDYNVDALPKSIKLRSEDNSLLFQRMINSENGKVNVSIVFAADKSFYSVDEYQTLKSFYKKMIDLLSEQVVLKKK